LLNLHNTEQQRCIRSDVLFEKDNGSVVRYARLLPGHGARMRCDTSFSTAALYQCGALWKEPAMLVLSRQRDETIMIGDDIEVTVVDIRGDKVRLGISAPKEIAVHRKEVYEAIKRENREAAQVKLKPEDVAGFHRSKPPNAGPHTGPQMPPAK
jgi:carbon storage regulator